MASCEKAGALVAEPRHLVIIARVALLGHIGQNTGREIQFRRERGRMVDRHYEVLSSMTATHVDCINVDSAPLLCCGSEEPITIIDPSVDGEATVFFSTPSIHQSFLPLSKS